MKHLYVIEPCGPDLQLDPTAPQLAGLIVAKGASKGLDHTFTLPPAIVQCDVWCQDQLGQLRPPGRYELAVLNTWLRPINPEPETETVHEVINDLAPHPQVEFTR